MTLRNLDKLDWGGGRGEDMHRTWWVKFLIESTSSLDGPYSIGNTPGLPTIGAAWNYGNDNDPYAVCLPTVECETVIKNEPNFWWIMKFTFSTKPFRLCAMSPLTNPLSQPDQISGSFVNYQERTCKRRDGKPIVSSSLEPIWVQRDKNRPTVSITQTRLSLGLAGFSQMIDTLNDATLWGLPTRCVKLRNVPWRRLVWGTCTFYYQRTLEFDIKYDTFDETEIRDQGHRWIDKAKAGYPTTIDRTDPRNFTRASDDRGNIEKIVLLDTAGEICTDPINHSHYIPKVELYNESNFLTLGIPTTL